jgi:small-conductance mechanosensitive channel
MIFTRKMEDTDKRKFISVFKFIKYITYVVVVFITLSIAGFSITPFLAASAALLVGLGLALQELFQDVIGGIFIIVDKSLLVGDIIEIDGKVGRVIDIKLRTTRAITRDDKIIIIPNHKFITETIYNYTQNRKTTREFVKVGVAYGSNTQLVKDLLLKSVEKQAGVLKSPKPFVLFEDFGDSALIFSIYFFISDSFVDPRIKSEIRFTIDELFRTNEITIPFPQRDVHIFQTNNNPKDINLADD